MPNFMKQKCCTMKKIIFTYTMFVAFTALAAAQEKENTTQRMPPVITQQQVELHEKQALEERQKLEEERHAELEKQKREEHTKITSTDNNRKATKKTSTTTGEQ